MINRSVQNSKKTNNRDRIFWFVKHVNHQAKCFYLALEDRFYIFHKKISSIPKLQYWMHADDLVRETFGKMVFSSFVIWLLTLSLVAVVDLFVCSTFFPILKITPPYLSLIPARYLSPDNKVLYQRLSECLTEKFENNLGCLWLHRPKR